MKRFFIIGTVVVLAGIAYLQRVAIKEYVFELTKEPLPVAVSYKESAKNAPYQPPTSPQATSSGPTAPAPKPLLPETRRSINLAVPFQAQAPFGDWVLPYKEACEEASLIMVRHFFEGTTLSAQQMKDEIDAQVAWLAEHMQGKVDITVPEVKTLGEALYPGYTFQILDNLTAEDIKTQLRLGRPVIVPAAGQELGNPYYRQPGPLYHMLVIKGFTEKGDFITNDPGTRRGADFVYDPDVLLNAIRDWDGAGPDGPKRGLVLFK